MYKVFLNNNFLVITNQTEKNINTIIKNYENIEQVYEWIHQTKEAESNDNLTLLCRNHHEVWSQIISNFGKIDAAGGLIKHDDKLLFIYRRGKWDLPKGKINANEKPWQAALREIKEETGLHSVKIIQPLPSTYHMYWLKNAFVIKQTYWYLMNFEGTEKPVPQLSEDIEKATWFTITEFKQLSNEAFGTVNDLMQYYMSTIHEQ